MDVTLVDRVGLRGAGRGLVDISFGLGRIGPRLELLRYFLADFDSECSLESMR